MVLDVSKIRGIGEFKVQSEPTREIYTREGRAFLVLHRNTLEIRCDPRLSQNLKTKYETVMDSRYFGQGGIEIVFSGQLSQEELEDLVRLSYNLST